MPNWCMNYTVIKNSDNPALLEQFAQAYNDGALMQYFRPCPADLTDTTCGSPATEQERAENDRKKEYNLTTHGHTDWYGWRCDNWGTKWDIGRREGDNPIRVKTKHGQKVIEVGFDSAWSPPLAFYEYLCDQFGFDIRGYYFEPGCGFCGSWHAGIENTISIEEFTPEWLAHNVPKRVLTVFNMIEEAEQQREQEAAWEAEKERNKKDA